MTWIDEKTHRQKVIAKLERVRGLEDLLAEWEAKQIDGLYSDEDYYYILKLRERLRSARQQYEAMRP